MKLTRRLMVLCALAQPVLGPAAMAQTPTDMVVDQLRAQGFSIESVERTWLGRVRVQATRGGLSREVVFDPRNGAVLRDFTSSDATGPQIGDDGGPGGAQRGGGNDADDDDDDGGPAGGTDSDDDDDGAGGGPGGGDDSDDDSDDGDGGGGGSGGGGGDDDDD